MLKNDDHNQQQRAEKGFQQPLQGCHIEGYGHEIDSTEHHQSKDHLHRTRALDNQDKLMNDKRHHQDIQDILPAKKFEYLKHNKGKTGNRGQKRGNKKDPSSINQMVDNPYTSSILSRYGTGAFYFLVYSIFSASFNTYLTRK